MSYQFQYATWTFHWETEELGFFLSLVSAVRAAILMIILPGELIFYLEPDAGMSESSPRSTRSVSEA